MSKQLLGKTFRSSLLVLLLPVVIFSQQTSGGTPNRETSGRLRIVVTGGEDSKPVKGADALVRWQSADRLFEESTRTNSQGLATISNVRHGTILIQITALGWKTAGRQQDFKDESPIMIQLEPDRRVEPPANPGQASSVSRW